MTSPADGLGRRAVLGFWLVLAVGWAGLAFSQREAPGVYYDEAWFGVEARRFVEPDRQAPLPPGSRSVELWGRPFPLFSAPYLGALKSQLQIPGIAVSGASAAALRITTLATALLAMLATLLATRRAFGTATALLTGALLACDPSVFFHAQWEWGPFTTGWLCRAAGAALLLRSVQEGGRGAAVAGAFLLGLSVYNRIDSILVLLALAGGIAIGLPRELLALVRSRRGDGIVAVSAGTLGALPMLLNLPNVLGSFGALRGRGDLLERARTLWTTLDGSYLHRLMLQGGRFDLLDEVSAPTALLGLGFVAALVGVLLRSLRGRRDAQTALAVACGLLAVALLSLRGATRAHHMLGLAPLAHVLVASCIVAIAGRGRAWRGLIAGVLTLGILASGARSIERTRELLAASGGRGWWTNALGAFADELEAQPGSVAVSLDWGFHLPLSLSTTTPRLLEPVWEVPREVRRRGRWTFGGGATHHYLVHAPPWDRFGLSAAFLRAARAAGPAVEVRDWRDGEGDVVFHSVRIRSSHRWSYQPRRGFRLELDPPEAAER